LSEPEPIPSSEYFSNLPRLPRDEGGPVFAEPWQAQAFALAVKLSEQGHFTWKEWATGLAEELQAAARRGEPDDGSRYYEHWLAALERLVTAKGLTDQTALATRREAWAAAYRTTPHGTPIELARKPDARWLLLGVAATLAGYWLIHQINIAPSAPAIPQVGLVASAALGSLLGMQHAFEPDHLAAVATLMTGERTSAKAAWLGAWWGLGHTLTLLAAGTALVVLRAEMPAPATMAFELGVVLLLVAFGLRAIYQAACHALPRRTHSHTKPGRRLSLVGIDRWTLARPLLVGAVHGLAGSGAMTALVVATLPSTATRLGYLLLFGIGSILGMVALSGLLGWQIARMGNDRAVVRTFSLAVGCVAAVLGLFWGYPILSRLFSTTPVPIATGLAAALLVYLARAPVKMFRKA
jgi:nitrile hydratase accessory protein